MKALSLLFILFCILGCRERKIVSEVELKNYVMDTENGLRQQQKKNGLRIEVIYRPKELVLAQQLDGITSTEERISTIKNSDSLTYFIIKLSKNEKEIENSYVSDAGKFARVIDYLSSSITQNLYLVNSNDTIPALDVVYTRMFGATPATTLMAVFNTKVIEKNGLLNFYFDDSELGLGQNRFDFSLNDMKKAPTINLN